MRTRSGSAALTFFLILSSFFACAGLLQSGKKRSQDAYSVVAGSVFREPGFALPGAEVTLTAAPGESSQKVKKMSFITNTRGEFAFRLAAAKANYQLSAAAKGFITQQKTVEVQPGERVDATFTLFPESNK